jgi:acetyl esterase/lipase
MLAKYLIKSTVNKLRKQADYTDIPKARLGMELATALSPTFHESVEYKQFKIEHINCKWVLPDKAHEKKVLLYFHGGGYASGSVQTHKSLVTQICKHGNVNGLLFDYRLSPEHQFPAPIEDSVKVYLWLLNNGYNASQIAFGGDSAGGGLAMATLMYIRDHQLASLPKCYIGLSPWMDLTGNSESLLKNANTDAMINIEAMDHWVNNYVGTENREHQYISPLFGKMHDLPEMYIQVCKVEVLHQDSISFYNKAKEHGLDIKLEEYGDLLHVWQAFWPILKEGREANEKLGKYIKDKLK